MTLPSDAVKTYEALRTTALNGNGARSGLAVIIYHGMIHGLQVFTTNTQSITPLPLLQNSTASSPSTNKALVRVLANMVLQSQPEVMHVY